MANSIRIQKTVVNKAEFSKVVNTAFSSFVEPEPAINTDTVQELFRLYNKLYYEIPTEGENSHTFLIQESSKLVTLEKDLTDIQPLLDEITELRERLLLVNQQLIEVQTSTITNVVQ